MKLALLYILTFLVLNGVFAQEETDSVVFENRCECLEYVYTFKKEFLESYSYSDDKVRLDSAFIIKHNFSPEKFRTIDRRCVGFNSDTHDEPCEYESKIAAMSDDFELIIRVIEMNRSVQFCGPPRER